MRVTNSMLVSNLMNNLNTNLTKMSGLYEQMSSGKKYPHISDDPVGLIYSQQARYKLARLADYESNVETAKSWLTQAEAGALEINSILASAYEACIDAATDAKSGKDMTNVAQNIGQMRDQLLQALNTAYGDKFVFGGYNTTGHTSSGETIAPFTVDDNGNLCYNGYDLTDPANAAIIGALREDVLTFDLSLGSSMPVTVNGIDMVFYGTDPNTGANLNIYNLLSDLYNTVNEGGPADAINDYISDLQNAQRHVLSITAELGGRANRLEILENRYAQDTLNYTQMLSDAEDIDLAEAIMNYKMAESVYKAALSAGSYIIQPTLMDFLN